MKALLSKPAKIPQKSGVYIFRDLRKKPLYIGKAANLRARLQSYFQANIPERIKNLRAESVFLDWEILPTEFNALIYEAELIKKYRPKFNILLRDDKSYYYVEFTPLEAKCSAACRGSKRQNNLANTRFNIRRELLTEFTKNIFPRVHIVHKPHFSSTLGPYTASGPLYMILRLLRKVFPYCTCKKPHARICLNAEIGRCLGFCCLKNANISANNLKQYKKNILAIRGVLTGKSQKLIKELRAGMRNSAKLKKYEIAAKYRDKIRALEQICLHKYIIAERNPFVLYNAKVSAELAQILGSQNPITRIEGYDTSMLMGEAAAAAMAVFENGLPKKSEYKRFQIKTDKTQSDADMLEEVITRRLAHNEWKLPDLMLIDGGAPQLYKVAKALRKKFGAKWPVLLAGLSKAKNSAGRVRRKASTEELLHIYGKPPINAGKLPVAVMHILQYARDESHRFAKSYHSALRSKIIHRLD